MTSYFLVFFKNEYLSNLFGGILYFPPIKKKRDTAEENKTGGPERGGLMGGEVTGWKRANKKWGETVDLQELMFGWAWVTLSQQLERRQEMMFKFWCNCKEGKHWGFQFIVERRAVVVNPEKGLPVHYFRGHQIYIFFEMHIKKHKWKTKWRDDHKKILKSERLYANTFKVEIKFIGPPRTPKTHLKRCALQMGEYFYFFDNGFT